MKILVPTKRVPDTDQKIVASGDGSRVQVEHIPYVINPFDAIALEEAVRISERFGDSVEVVAVGIGGRDTSSNYGPHSRWAPRGRSTSNAASRSILGTLRDCLQPLSKRENRSSC